VRGGVWAVSWWLSMVGRGGEIETADACDEDADEDHDCRRRM
jgi:hypothetical protein